MTEDESRQKIVATWRRLRRFCRHPQGTGGQLARKRPPLSAAPCPADKAWRKMYGRILSSASWKNPSV